MRKFLEREVDGNAFRNYNLSSLEVSHLAAGSSRLFPARINAGYVIKEDIDKIFRSKLEKSASDGRQ